MHCMLTTTNTSAMIWHDSRNCEDHSLFASSVRMKVSGGALACCLLSTDVRPFATMLIGGVARVHLTLHDRVAFLHSQTERLTTQITKGAVMTLFIVRPDANIFYAHHLTQLRCSIFQATLAKVICIQMKQSERTVIVFSLLFFLFFYFLMWVCLPLFF